MTTFLILILIIGVGAAAALTGILLTFWLVAGAIYLVLKLMWFLISGLSSNIPDALRVPIMLVTFTIISAVIIISMIG